MKIYIIFLTYCCMLFFPLWSSPNFSDHHDLKVLEVFFRMLIQEEEMGYVMEGIKPISWIPYSDFNDCWTPEEDCYKREWAISEGVKVWRKYAPKKNSKIMICIPSEECHHVNCQEILVIHVPSFLAICREHLSLFKYILGPATTPEGLLSEMISLRHSFLEILHKNNTLIGLLLGFKMESSLIASRLETICGNITHRDCPPFLPTINAAEGESFSILSSKHLIESYLEDHDYIPCTKEEKCNFRPSFGFSSLAEELAYWKTKEINLPKPLLEGKPRFIFAAYEGEETKNFINQLLLAQNRIQQLLQKPYILPNILPIIYQESVEVPTDYLSPTVPIKLINKTYDLNLIMARNIWRSCLQIEDEIRSVCLTAFSNAVTSQTHLKEFPWHPLGTNLAGLKAVKKNLKQADAYFSYLESRDEVTWIVPKGLCYWTQIKGEGENISNCQQVLLSYRFVDDSDNWLAAEHKIWVNLQDTLPSFVHAIQGMKIGEKRSIYIHPSLAYGVVSGLKSGSFLYCEVVLHAGDKERQLPSLPPLLKKDFSFLNDNNYFLEIKRDLEGMYSYLINELALYIKKRKEFDIVQVNNYLIQLSNGSLPYRSLNNEESDILTSIAWNQCFGDQTKNL